MVVVVMMNTGSVVVASSKVVVDALEVGVDSVDANLAASASSTSLNNQDDQKPDGVRGPGWIFF